MSPETATDAPEGDARPVLGLVAHELRTPLHAVRGFAELLLSGAVGPLHAEALGCVQEIARAGRALQQVSDLLQELVGMGPAAPATGAGPVDLGAILRALGFALDEGGLPMVVGEPAAWRRVGELCGTYLAWPGTAEVLLVAHAARADDGGLELELRRADMRGGEGVGLLAIELARRLVSRQGGALGLEGSGIVVIRCPPSRVAAVNGEA